MTIVAGYVPGDLGEAVIEAAAAEAERRGSDLVVLNTTRGVSAVDRSFVSHTEQRAMAARMATLGVKAVFVSTMAKTDEAHELLDLAAERDAELIVVGVRRRSPTGKFLMGSTSQRVILEADCPVLAVKS